MEASLGLSVGRERHKEGKNRGEEVRWSSEEKTTSAWPVCNLRVDLGHAKGVDDGGNERGDGSGGSLGDLDQSEQPELVVGYRELERLEEGDLLDIGGPGVFLEAVYRKRFLLGREPSGARVSANIVDSLLRVIREDKNRSDTSSHSDSPLNDKHPSPSCQTQRPLHAALDARADEPGKGAG